MIYTYEIPVIGGLRKWGETPRRLLPPERFPVPRPEPRECFNSTISIDYELISKTTTHGIVRSLTS